MKYLALALACVFAVACDLRTPLAPTGSTVTLQLSATRVPIGGQITARAVVAESGGSLTQNGTLVAFVGGLGTWTPVEAPTINGVASSTFTATGTGITKFGAFSGGARAIEVDVTVGTVTPTTVPPPPAAPPANPTIALTCGTAVASVGVATSCTLMPTAGGNPIRIVAIEWGDGTGVQNLGPLTSTTVVAHTFASAGTYQAVATVIDTLGQEGKASAAIAVTRQVPTISISGPATGTVGVAVVFAVSAFSAIGPTTVVVEFGDGSSRTSTGSGVTKTYGSVGTFPVSATVTDAVGTRATESTTIAITAAPVPPPPTIARTSVFLSQDNPAGASGCAAFGVTATAATGTTITVIEVTHSNGLRPWTLSGSGGRIVTCGLTANADILTATAIDSAGGRATYQLIVR